MNNKNIAWAIYSTFQLKILVTHCIVIKNQADEHSKIYIQCYYCFHGVIFLFKTPKYVSFVDKQETCNVAIRLTLLRNGCNAAKQVTFYVEKPKTLVPSCTPVLKETLQERNQISLLEPRNPLPQLFLKMNGLCDFIGIRSKSPWSKSPRP